MQKRTKFLAALLLCASYIGMATAQNGASYADLATPPLFRYLQKEWTTPPLFSLWQKHAKAVMQDSELSPKTVGQDANFYANPLKINGQSLDYGRFDFSTKGILTVVKGDPDSKDAQPIAFYVSIRRNGKILKDKKMSFLDKALYQVNLSDIFSFAEDGDVLIVNPVNAENWKAKRLLKLIGGSGC